MTETMLAPVAGNERIDVLDVLRGLALLGIALMNVEYFTASLLGTAEGVDPQAHGLDRVADAFVYIFVRSKFWTLFSLLFGMGFAVMLMRAQAAGRAFVPLYLRRTVGLLVIGVAHAVLVWSGDILASYAIAAFALLLFFRDADAGRLWRWGVGLWSVLVGLMLLSGVLMMVAEGMPGGAGVEPTGADTLAMLGQAENAAYSGGSYAEATAVRWRVFLHMLGFNAFLLPLVLGMFLLGGWLVRSGAIGRPREHRRLFARLAWLGGGIGLALTLASLAIDAAPDSESARSLVATTLHMAGAPLMSLAYIGIVVLAMERGASWLGALAPAGRMALTHYIAQSLIGTWVFYGYGLGQWGEVSRSWQVLGVVVVFALQVLASHWWLRRFRYGPLEWLWRACTYGRVPPMRRLPATAGPV